MVDRLTNLPNPILDSLVEFLDDESLEMLTRTNKSIYTTITSVPVWKDRIGCHGLMKIISCYMAQKTHDGTTRIYRQSEGYKNFHNLFELTSYTNNEMKVYVPIYPTHKMTIEEMIKKFAVFEQQDVRPLLENKPVHYIFLLDKLEVIADILYRTVIKPLVNLSKKCTIQYNKISCKNPYEIVVSNIPVLEFTLTYINYINILEYLTTKEHNI